MKSVISALIAAFGSLFHPKMFSLVLWPVLAAVLLWLGAAYVFWGSWVDSLTGLLLRTPLAKWKWIGDAAAATASHDLVVVLLVVLLLTAIYLTVLVVTAVFAMPVMLSHVAERYYPGLERKRGGTTAGSIANTVVAIAIYCAGWALSLPVWLFTPLALVLPVALSAYLNKRLFPYDALSEHASREEFSVLVRHAAVKLYLLGAITGLLQAVPVLNLLLPVYTGLAYIHLCLAELTQLRQSA